METTKEQIKALFDALAKKNLNFLEIKTELEKISTVKNLDLQTALYFAELNEIIKTEYVGEAESDEFYYSVKYSANALTPENAEKLAEKTYKELIDFIPERNAELIDFILEIVVSGQKDLHEINRELKDFYKSEFSRQEVVESLLNMQGEERLEFAVEEREAGVAEYYRLVDV